MITQHESSEDRLERIERIVSGIADDISVLKDDVSVLKDDVSVLKDDVSVLKDDVSVLKDDVSVLKDDVSVLKDDVSVLKDDVSVLKDDVSVLKDDVSVLKDDVSVLKDDVSVLKDDVSVLKDDVSVMKGWQTELAVERRAGQVFARLCGGELLRIYPTSELRYYSGQIRRAGGMSRDDVSRAESIDFLLEGTDSGGRPVIYAVEASYTVGPDDIARAVTKAGLLTKLLGREVRPAVVGEAFTAQLTENADSQNVAYAFVRNGDAVKR